MPTNNQHCRLEHSNKPVAKAFVLFYGVFDKADNVVGLFLPKAKDRTIVAGNEFLKGSVTTLSPSHLKRD